MRSELQKLISAIEAIERRDAPVNPKDERCHFPTGWSQVDQRLNGGLRRGAVHEWFGVVDFGVWILDFGLQARPTAGVMHDLGVPSQSTIQNPQSKIEWSPPLSIFIHMAWRAVEENLATGAHKLVIWIGRFAGGNWPHPQALVRNDFGFSILDFGSQTDHTGSQSKIQNPKSKILLHRSLFIDPPDDASRLWAIDLALRSPAVALVIADGSRLDMAASRRLQLAAESGSALALLARPPDELDQLSAATTRWLVRPEQATLISRQTSSSFSRWTPRWTIDLLRCKGVRPVANLQRSWSVEWNNAACAVAQPADVADRPGAPPRPQPIIACEPAA